MPIQRVILACALILTGMFAQQPLGGVVGPATQPAGNQRPFSVIDVSPAEEPFRLEVISTGAAPRLDIDTTDRPFNNDATPTPIPLPAAAFGGSLLLTIWVARRGRRIISPR